MDSEVTKNNFKNTYAYCKNCAYQDKEFWFNSMCKVYPFCKPRDVMDNKKCEFYTEKTEK